VSSIHHIDEVGNDFAEAHRDRQRQNGWDRDRHAEGQILRPGHQPAGPARTVPHHSSAWNMAPCRVAPRACFRPRQAAAARAGSAVTGSAGVDRHAHRETSLTDHGGPRRRCSCPPPREHATGHRGISVCALVCIRSLALYRSGRDSSRRSHTAVLAARALRHSRPLPGHRTIDRFEAIVQHELLGKRLLLARRLMIRRQHCKRRQTVRALCYEKRRREPSRALVAALICRPRAVGECS